MSGKEVKERIKANACRHCGGWLAMVHELNRKILKLEEKNLKLTKEVNDLLQKGMK
jgi:hypothetical protein